MSIHKSLKYILPLLPFICFIAGYVISNLFVGTSSHKTPHLIGLTIHEAFKATSQNHVTIKLVAEKECHGVTPGTIMTQKPVAGRLMKPNQTILVTVSKQPIVKVAPMLLLKNITQIAQIIKDNSLKMRLYPQTYSLPQDTCIAQTPQPNMPLIDKKMIVYVAQEKQNLYIMPDFVGKELSMIIHALKPHQLQLTVIHDHEKINSPYPENLMVITQKPQAGSFITLSPNLTIQIEAE